MATTTSPAITTRPARAAAIDEPYPKGLVIMIALIVSLAMVIGLTFWLASDIHTTASRAGATTAAE